MKFLLREPLVHFLLIGGGLFLLFGLYNDPVGQGANRIVITPGQADSLKANFTRTWQRQPSAQEMQGLIDSYVREEIFYREAMALGLDKEDTVVRRRLKQKLEIMSDDLAGVATPSDDELRSFLATHPERFRIEPQVAFRHIFFNVDKGGGEAVGEAQRLLAVLSDGGDVDPDMLGDTLTLLKSFNMSPASQIARLFGQAFSQELITIKPGQWAGPIRSGYGLHLVLVTDRVDGSLPELDQVRETVEREWMAVHKKEVQERIYSRFRERYTVVFEEPAKGTKPFQAVKEARAAQEKPQ